MPVLSLPPRPPIEATPFVTPEGPVPGITLYSLTSEQTEIPLASIWSRQAQEQFSEWLREVLARFEANRCALLAINGKSCETTQAEPQTVPMYDRLRLYPLRLNQPIEPDGIE